MKAAELILIGVFAGIYFLVNLGAALLVEALL